MQTEKRAEELLVAHLERSAWRVARQVSLGAKRVDILAERDGQLWAIEVKLRDWRRGAAQAFLNAAYVDKSYVALPRNAGRRLDNAAFDELGIGLIEFDDDGWTEERPSATSGRGPKVRLRG